jgi:hypothetical protein
VHRLFIDSAAVATRVVLAEGFPVIGREDDDGAIFEILGSEAI